RQKIAEVRTDWLSERDVGGNALPKKCVHGAPTSAVIKLRRQQHISRRIFFLQTAHGCYRDDPANVQRTQRIDVGPMIDFVRQNPMATTVARQKINLTPANLSANERVRRWPEWFINVEFAGITQFFYLIETAATNDSNCRRFILFLGHAAI